MARVFFCFFCGKSDFVKKILSFSVKIHKDGAPLRRNCTKKAEFLFFLMSVLTQNIKDAIISTIGNHCFRTNNKAIGSFINMDLNQNENQWDEEGYYASDADMVPPEAPVEESGTTGSAAAGRFPHGSRARAPRPSGKRGS